MGVIAVLALINYFGVRVGGDVQVVFTLVKVGLIAAIILIGLGSGAGSGANYQSSIPAPGGITGFFAALIAALWAYDGWNNVSMVASEVRNPQRNLPRALIAGTLAVIAIYLLANLAYFYVLPASRCCVYRSCRGRDDAADSGISRSGSCQHCRHDLHFCRSKRLDTFRLPRAVRHGAGWFIFSAGGLRSSQSPHAQRFDSRPERLGRACSFSADGTTSYTHM